MREYAFPCIKSRVESLLGFIRVVLFITFLLVLEIEVGIFWERPSISCFCVHLMIRHMIDASSTTSETPK
jgi:hypothetical protein